MQEVSFLTLRDVRLATGLSQSGIELHVLRGNLRTVKVGNMHLIEPDEYRRFLAARFSGQYTRQARSKRRNP
jgi:hypothetical protein